MTAPRCLQSFKAGCIATEIPPQLPLKYWKKKNPIRGFVAMTTDTK